jgi:hypothetical protein
MTNKTQEALDLLQEECAEVIVEVSKIRRFGLETKHYKKDLTHSEMLEIEVGDVLALIDILVEQGVLDTDRLAVAKANKRIKLHQWSNLFKN